MASLIDRMPRSNELLAVAVGIDSEAEPNGRAFGHRAYAAEGATAIGHGVRAEKPGEVVVQVDNWHSFIREMTLFMLHCVNDKYSNEYLKKEFPETYEESIRGKLV